MRPRRADARDGPVVSPSCSSRGGARAANERQRSVLRHPDEEEAEAGSLRERRPPQEVMSLVRRWRYFSSV